MDCTPYWQTNRRLPVVVEDMGGADVGELVKAAGLLAAQDCVALLGAAGERAILVASIGASGLARRVAASDIIKAAAHPAASCGVFIFKIKYSIKHLKWIGLTIVISICFHAYIPLVCGGQSEKYNKLLIS